MPPQNQESDADGADGGDWGLLLLLQAHTAAQVPTPVSCGSVITEPGEYALVADVFCTDNGITIAASGVRLDLRGFTLTGPGALVFVCGRAGRRCERYAVYRWRDRQLRQRNRYARRGEPDSPRCFS